MTKREFLLERIVAVLKTIAPGVVYTFPFAQFGTYNAIQTDLKGRVYDKMRPFDKIDRASTPCVEVITSPAEQDTLRYLDNEMIERTVSVKLWGYVYGGTGGEIMPNTTAARAAANQMDADISVAMEALKWWTDTSSPATSDPLTALLGSIDVAHDTSWTDTETGQAWAMLVMGYRFTYTYNRRKP